MLNETSKKYLSEMGWYPLRQVNTQDMENALSNQGFRLNVMAIKFLKEFGGLSGLVPRDSLQDIQKISFDILSVSKNYFPDWANDVYNVLVKEELCLIGSAYNGSLQLYISETGKLFGAFDGFLELLGEDAYSGLNILLSSKKGKVIEFNVDEL